MEGNGKYPSCPDCGNTASGTEILRCDFCDHVYCTACVRHRKDPIADGPVCRSCKGYLITALGDRHYKVLGRIA
jgi:hypothetical protein